MSALAIVQGESVGNLLFFAWPALSGVCSGPQVQFTFQLSLLQQSQGHLSMNQSHP